MASKSKQGKEIFQMERFYDGAAPGSITNHRVAVFENGAVLEKFAYWFGKDHIAPGNWAHKTKKDGSRLKVPSDRRDDYKKNLLQNGFREAGARIVWSDYLTKSYRAHY